MHPNHTVSILLTASRLGENKLRISHPRAQRMIPIQSGAHAGPVGGRSGRFWPRGGGGCGDIYPHSGGAPAPQDPAHRRVPSLAQRVQQGPSPGEISPALRAARSDAARPDEPDETRIVPPGRRGRRCRVDVAAGEGGSGTHTGRADDVGRSRLVGLTK
ncbi:hypothetical protein IFM5058_10559 [Aspergillus udagawae]|nr:hypothetical protein IFM5058_10559 [Aspergillus udagawae]